MGIRGRNRSNNQLVQNAKNMRSNNQPDDWSRHGTQGHSPLLGHYDFDQVEVAERRIEMAVRGGMRHRCPGGVAVEEGRPPGGQLCERHAEGEEHRLGHLKTQLRHFYM